MDRGTSGTFSFEAPARWNPRRTYDIIFGLQISFISLQNIVKDALANGNFDRELI